MEGEIFNIPESVTRIFVGASWHLISGEMMDYDLSCIIFRADGVLQDTVYHGCLSNQGNSIRHVGDDRTGLGDLADEDETIIVHTNKCSLEETALVFSISCIQDDDVPLDLMRADYFSLRVYCQGDGNRRTMVTNVDLKPFVTYDDKTVIPLVLFRMGNLWTAQIIGKSSRAPNWGFAIPELKATLVGLPPMDEFEINPYEKVKIGRKYEDRALDVLANVRHGAGGLAVAERHVTRVRMDLGWTLEVTKGTNIDVNLIFFDTFGSELFILDSRDKDWTGAHMMSPEEMEESEVEGAGAFPVNVSVMLDLTRLPKEVKSCVASIGSYMGNGLQSVNSVNVRLVDASAQDHQLHRDVVVYNVDTRTSDAHVNAAVVVCKLYKEAKNSAYFQWKNSETATIEDFVGSGTIKDTVDYVREHKSEAVDNAAGGEFEWRIRSVALFSQGRTIADKTVRQDAQSVAVYDGRRDKKGRRTDKRAKCCYPNGDTYFGEYRLGKRNGLGVYVMRKGGLYAGRYKKGQRHGHGLLAAPDGSYYEGDWVEDVMTGRGVYSYADGSRFTGSFKDGKKDGDGQYVVRIDPPERPARDHPPTLCEGPPPYADGSFITGSWKMGELEGASTFDAANHHFEGTFRRDALKGPSRHTVAVTPRSKLRPRSIPETLKPELALLQPGKYDYPDEGPVPTFYDTPHKYRGMRYQATGKWPPEETEVREYSPMEIDNPDEAPEQDAEGTTGTASTVAQLYGKAPPGDGGKEGGGAAAAGEGEEENKAGNKGGETPQGTPKKAARGGTAG